MVQCVCYLMTGSSSHLSGELPVCGACGSCCPGRVLPAGTLPGEATATQHGTPALQSQASCHQGEPTECGSTSNAAYTTVYVYICVYKNGFVWFYTVVHTVVCKSITLVLCCQCGDVNAIFTDLSLYFVATNEC